MKSFSSGEVAKICDVTPRTVIRWIDSGKLNAFKLPGRGNNRIDEPELLAFLEQNNIPVPAQLAPSEEAHCVIVTQDAYLLKHARRMVRNADYVVSAFHSGIEAGFEIASKKPRLIILDEDIDSSMPCQIQSQIEKAADYSPHYIVFSNATKTNKRNQPKLTRLCKPVSLNAFSLAIEGTMGSDIASA